MISWHTQNDITEFFSEFIRSQVAIPDYCAIIADEFTDRFSDKEIFTTLFTLRKTLRK